MGWGGRGLLEAAQLVSPNPNLFQAFLFANTATSSYNALQLQFQRRLSHGLQALSSYTWSHSIDNGSAGSGGNASNMVVSAAHPNPNRRPSYLHNPDVFSAGTTYDRPAPKTNA